MRLESSIVIHRMTEDVWNFLWDINNVAKWDRGVSCVKQTSHGPVGIGFEFETIGHPHFVEDTKPWGQMSYRIIDMDSRGRCTVQLTSSTGNARYFKQARWNFLAEPVQGGTKLTCSAEFALRPRYIILAPILYVMRGAIHRDLKELRRVLEDDRSGH
jgi:Polyketide cyclase / dehydrase and lipid transport